MRSAEAPATITKRRKEDCFEFRQLVFAMSIGFMVRTFLQASRHLTKMLQAIHFEQNSAKVRVARREEVRCKLHDVVAESSILHDPVSKIDFTIPSKQLELNHLPIQ